MSSQHATEYYNSMVRSWHLAILRFAVTRDNADRLGVFAIANAIDSLGRPNQVESHFEFFRKTSSKLCAVILQPDTAVETVLRSYLTNIDDVRLKNALAAALGIGRALSEKRQAGRDTDLWRGLPARGNPQH